MDIFRFTDYRLFLKSIMATYPHRGRGQARALAGRVQIHPTVMSHIFAGKRELTEEQAIEAAEYFELSTLESKYFCLLVRQANAGTHKLRQSIQKEIQEVRQASQALASRVPTKKTLGETEGAVFYSSWLYAACRLYCSTSRAGKSIEEVASRFGIRRVRAMNILEFLVSAQLCTLENGRYQMGPQSTFVAMGNPLLACHHANWRIQGIRAFDDLSASEMMFTGVLSVSRSDFESLREKLAVFLKEFSKTVECSPAEEVACLNIDFFWIRK